MIKDKEALGLLALRIGIGSVFFIFGIDKFFHTQFWVNWIPTWMSPLLPVSDLTFMFGMGVFETVIGAMLLIGWFTRIAGTLAALNMIGILFSMGFPMFLTKVGVDDTMLRDTSLFLMAAGVALLGGGKYSLDAKQDRD